MNEYSKGSKANKAFSRDDIFLQYGSQCIDIENFEFIDGVTTLDRIIPNKLIFLDSFSDQSHKAISAAEDSGCLFILPREYKDNLVESIGAENERGDWGERLRNSFPKDSLRIP